ncbi:MAG: hypothetical protein H6511_09685 [Holophagales bacterium]|nr:hypothetical protein [Holophagales bacterium]
MVSAPARRALVLAVGSLLPFLAAPATAQGSVTGKYVGNGREAKLGFVRVIPHEEFSGEKAWTLVVSEKDSKSSKKPDFDAQFGELGDALVVSVTEKGDIFSVQVCHQQLDKAGFSSSGTVQVEGFTVAGGKLSGHFFTKGENEFFGDTWSVDLKISGDLPRK